MKINKVFLLLIISAFFCCKAPHSIEEKNLTKKEMLSNPKKSEIKSWEGKIEKKPFYNKINRPIPGIYDLFFVRGKDQFFIKAGNNEKFTKEMVEEWIGKKVQITGRLHDGLWDTNDPSVQSRVGTYLTIDSIALRNR